MRATHANNLSCLISGIGLGLLAGLLWAPRAGKEIRDEIRRGTDSRLVNLRHEAEQIRAGATHGLGRILEYFRANTSRRRHGNFAQSDGQK